MFHCDATRLAVSAREEARNSLYMFGADSGMARTVRATKKAADQARKAHLRRYSATRARGSGNSLNMETRTQTAAAAAPRRPRSVPVRPRQAERKTSEAFWPNAVEV